MKTCRINRSILLFALFFILVPNMVYAMSAFEWFSKGIEYENNKDNDGAIYAYSQAIYYYPDYAKAYNNRGIVYLNKNRYDEAIRDFSKALEKDPKHIGAYNNRALAYDKKGLYDLAIEDCNKAIAIKPGYFVTYDNRATIYNHKGLYDQAIADCNQALKLNSKVADIYYVRGEAYRLKAMYEAALIDYNKAISLDSNFTEAYVGRGELYNAINKSELAAADFNRAKQINPNILANSLVNLKIIKPEPQKKRIITILEKPLSLDDFRLYDVDLKISLDLQMTEAEVKSNYGEPTDRESEGGAKTFSISYVHPDGKTDFIFWGLLYDKKGQFIAVKMSDITSTKKSITTPRNIAIGDTEEDLVRAYGSNLIKKKLDGFVFYNINSNNTTSGNLLFVMNTKGEIVRIALSNGHGI